jgi:hypothetical protein
MYNHSIVSADRSTHLKIVVIPLAIVGLIVVGAINAGFGNLHAAPAQIGAKGAVVKASKTIAYASRGSAVIR